MNFIRNTYDLLHSEFNQEFLNAAFDVWFNDTDGGYCWLIGC